jgi:hypothetical protein
MSSFYLEPRLAGDLDSIFESSCNKNNANLECICSCAAGKLSIARLKGFEK